MHITGSMTFAAYTSDWYWLVIFCQVFIPFLENWGYAFPNASLQVMWLYLVTGWIWLWVLGLVRSLFLWECRLWSSGSYALFILSFCNSFSTPLVFLVRLPIVRYFGLSIAEELFSLSSVKTNLLRDVGWP